MSLCFRCLKSEHIDRYLKSCLYRKIRSCVYRCFVKMTTLETLNFDNLALRRLPIDSEERNYVRTVNGACFSKLRPTPVESPETVSYSKNAMMLIDLPETELQRKDFADYFSGNKLLPGSETAAHCYCGHQFGYFSGQLGDGAAMYLGEIVNRKGERWEIQFKGAGLTPYSRSADGRKVLRSSIREFLCSEAVHFLGIPTTRAGTCITSDSKVIRDIYYDGHPIQEKCSIILRIAPTFLRFGSFEIFKPLDQFTGRRGPSIGRNDILHTMLDYTVDTFFPEIYRAHKGNNQKMYEEFFKEVVLRTARLVALWQCVGFCHGVLNTDNMSIVGITIDYGPFGFMDRYDPDHICNASDDGGRYTYIKQPEICLWNLQKLAEAIQGALPLVHSMPLLDFYKPEFELCYTNKMRQKLGLIRKNLPEDKELIQNLFDTMENTGADFTNTFRCLNMSTLPGLPDYSDSFNALKQTLIKQCYPLEVLIKSCKAGMDSGQFQMFLLLLRSNPDLMNTLGKEGLGLQRVMARMEKAKNLEKMTPESKEQNDDELWSCWLESYKCRLQKEVEGVENLDDLKNIQDKRVEIMNANNPKYILRNYIAQNAINMAESDDYSEVNHVLKLLETPYDELPVTEALKTDAVSSNQSPAIDSQGGASASCSRQRSHVQQLNDVENLPPDWALNLKVT